MLKRNWSASKFGSTVMQASWTQKENLTPHHYVRSQTLPLGSRGIFVTLFRGEDRRDRRGVDFR